MAKDWKVSRQRNQMITSASQYETATMCIRKWWLSRVRKLKEPDSIAQIFGDCLHGVVERYLGANNTESDLVLYPEGWHITKNRFTGDPVGEVTPMEQALIKKLVRAAIDEGIIHREPNGVIERPFRRQITKHKDVTVMVQGFIDYDVPGEVQDHKTSKNTRYLKLAKPTSPNYLGKVLQMLLYGKEHILYHYTDAGLPEPKELRLRHNQFVKEPKANGDLVVRKTSVLVTMDDLNNQWATCVDLSHRMVNVRKNANTWSDVEPPAEPKKACNAYGGCSFMKICFGNETENQYENRVAKGQQQGYTSKGHLLTKGQEKMNKLAAKLAARRAAAGGAPPPEATVNAPEEAPTEAVTPVEENPSADYVHEGSTPPWADPDCLACEGVGLNTKANPCRICDNTAKANGDPQSKEFDSDTDDAGNVTWKLKGSDAPPATAAVVSEPVTAETKEADEPAPAATPKPGGRLSRLGKGKTPEATTEAPAETPTTGVTTPKTDVESPSSTVAADATAKPLGRPKKGFILCINCSPIKGVVNKKGTGRAVYFLDEVLHNYGEAMAKDNNVESFYDLEAFARRDALAKAAGEMADSFGADIVVAMPRTAELRTLTEALRPHASMIIEAMGVL